MRGASSGAGPVSSLRTSLARHFARYTAAAQVVSAALASEQAAHLLAALEPALMWGEGGRTRFVWAPGMLAEIVEAGADRHLAFYLAVVAVVPVSDRQARRLRAPRRIR